MKNENYISIVIPAFNRFDYLKTLVNSIFAHADYPFELIIHDDASDKDTTNRIISELRDKFSTYILNPNIGWNMGLSESVDRCTQLATSKYVLMLNADCKMTGNCLQDIVNTLDKEFVGYITPHESNDMGSFFINKNTAYALYYGLGGGAVTAFRKNVWEEVGGWSGDDPMWSGGADTNFFGKVYSKGYFRASINGKQCFYNMSLLDQGNQDTTINGQVHDCSLPKVFNIYNGPSIEELSMDRYRNIDHGKHAIEKIPRATNNSNFWHNITKDFNDFPNINWELAEQNGFGRFKEQILKEVLHSK